MDSSTSSENIIQQVESLRNELEDCRKTLEISKYNELNYRNLVENTDEAILVAQNGIFQ